MWKQIVVAVAFGSGCVSVSSSSALAKELRKHRTTVETVAGSLVYSATFNRSGSTLTVLVRSEEICRTSTFPVFHEVEKTNRVVNDACGTPGSQYRFCDTHPAYPAVLGALLGGLGGLIYAEADHIGTPPTAADASGDKATPDDVRIMGLVVAAIGVPFIVIAVVDGIRLRDTTKDLGEVEEAPDITTASCHDRAVANANLVLSLDGVGWRVTGETDASGRITLALRDMPEAAFSSSDDGIRFVVGISENSTIQLALSKEETADLREALTNDPGSRISTERATAKATADAKQAAAKLALATCHSDVERGDLDAAASCWRDHADDWSVLNIADDQVSGCLSAASQAIRQIHTCAAMPERKDSDIVAKAKCLNAFIAAPTSCGIFDFNALKNHIDKTLDLETIETRVSLKFAVAEMRQDATNLLSTGTGDAAFRFGSGALELVRCQESRCRILLFSDNTILSSPPFFGTLARRTLVGELKLPTGLPLGYPQFATVRQEWTLSADATKASVTERSTLPDDQGRLKNAPAIRSNAVLVSCKFHPICSKMIH